MIRLLITICILLCSTAVAQYRNNLPDTSNVAQGAIQLLDLPAASVNSSAATVTDKDKFWLWLAFTGAGMMPAVINHVGGQYGTDRATGWALGGMALSAASTVLSLNYYIRANKPPWQRTERRHR